ncbi:hypothetical protein KEJ17_02095 [Candidatus Bathyarchaeota archaeon]|nr:hypothetical protein [Candidatus Bathyarchaeota archaeon]
MSSCPIVAFCKRAEFLALLIFFILSVFSLRDIFVTDDPVAFHDLAPICNFNQLFRPYDFPWDYKSNLGSPNMLTGNAVYNLPLLGLSLLLGSVPFAHKLLLVILSTLTGLGFYLTFSFLLGSRTAGFASGLYSMFNPFTFTRWIHGHNTILFAYMVLPFATFFYLKTVRDCGRKSLIGCGLLLGLLFTINPHVTYMFATFILLHAIFNIAFTKNGEKAVKAKLMAAQLSLIFGIALTVVFPFLYQLSMVNLPVYSVRAEEAVLVFSASDVVMYILPSIALFAFISLAFLYFWKKKIVPVSDLIKAQRQICLFFITLSFLTVLLILLVAVEPLKLVYQWLFNTVPGFSMFREANKFTLFLVLSAAYFLGLTAESIRLCVSKNGSFTKRNALTLLLVSLVVFASSWQFLTGNMGGHIGTVKIPDDYLDLEEWLSHEKGDFRVAFFPPAVWATTYNWALRWFLDPLVALQNKPTVELKSEFDITQSASLTRWVYTALYSNRTVKWGKLLGVLGVKYVIVRLDADMPSFRDDLKGFSLFNTLVAFGNQQDLIFEKRLGSLIIYRNPSQLPHIYESRGFSLIVGDRRMLISLNHVNFNFQGNPAVFLDDNLGLAYLFFSNASYMLFQGDPYWNVILSYLNGHFIIRPWLYASLSTNPTDKWVKGDLVWHRFNGDLNVAPDGYIYTEGANTIKVPLNVENSGEYLVLIQVYNGLPGSQGVRFNINNFYNYTFQPTRYFEGSYVWVELGNLSLSSRSLIEISSLGGPAAISKIAIIPKGIVDEAKEEAVRKIQASNSQKIYIFDTYTWNFSTNALAVNPKASNGRLIDLSKSGAQTRFYVFKDEAYTLTLKLQCREGASLKVYVDDNEESVTVKQQNEEFAEVNIGPFELKKGYHYLKVEGKMGDVKLDMAVLRTNVKEDDAIVEDLRRLNYTMLSSSEYAIYRMSRSVGCLVFLEGGCGYWKLYGNRSNPTIVNAFNYASLFIINEPEDQYTLKYVGLDFLTQGLLLALPIALISSLGVAFLRFKKVSQRALLKLLIFRCESR